MCISYYLLGKKQGGGSATLQNKSVTITQNGSQTITADTGYDGLSGVAVTTNVPTGADGEKLKKLIERDNSNYITFEIPSGITKIGAGSFSRWSKLTNLIIPNSVTSIDANAFEECEKLHDPTIPNSVTTIGNYAFSECKGLNNFVIPNSVTSIGDFAFSGCQNLQSITLSNGLTTISSNMFSSCSALASVIIPNTVTLIKYGAFNSCSELTEIIIPNSVVTITGGSFNYCSKLKKLDCTNCTQIPTLTGSNFSGVASNFKIVVPDALYENWIIAPNWSSYANKTVKASEYIE